MNLNEKPLYALRDLGKRLGVPSATKYKKDVLIEQIYKRKKEIENSMPATPKSTHSRPKPKSCFIGIDKDEKGKIVFFDLVLEIKKEREKEIKMLEESKKVFQGIIAAIDCYIKTLDC